MPSAAARSCARVALRSGWVMRSPSFSTPPPGAAENLPGARVRKQWPGHHGQIIGQGAADVCAKAGQILGGADQILDLEAPGIEMERKKTAGRGWQCGGAVGASGYFGARAGRKDNGACRTALRIQRHASPTAAKPRARGQSHRHGEGPGHGGIHCRATA